MTSAWALQALEASWCVRPCSNTSTYSTCDVQFGKQLFHCQWHNWSLSLVFLCTASNMCVRVKCLRWLHNDHSFYNDRGINVSFSMSMFWVEQTCLTLLSLLSPELSEKYSVEWQLDAYVDHLGEETHLANFTYRGHRLCLLTGFIALCIICTIELL